MTDIVERMRELYQFAAQQKSRDWDEQDEIRDLFKYTFNVAYEAADEIERLREALREIRDFDTFENISNEECMRDIAHAALGEKE